MTKLAAEQLCSVYWRRFGVDVVPPRFFTVYGPRQRTDMAFHQFIEAIIRGNPLTLYGDGLQQRDFTSVADVVAILLVGRNDRAEGLEQSQRLGSAAVAMLYQTGRAILAGGSVSDLSLPCEQRVGSSCRTCRR